MSHFYKFIELSKRIAASLLKEKEPIDLQKSKLFNKEDKDYILKNLTDKALVKERNNLSEKIGTQEDWKAVKNKVNMPVKKMIFWRYAAASIIIGALISIPLLLDKTAPTNTIESATPIVKNNDIIVVGTDKATLTLEDGSNIELEKGKMFKNNTINSNGEKLIYTKPSKPKAEIAYNYLTIPRGGQYNLVLSDGTEVWLNSESRLKFPVAFIEGETRLVELVYGEAYFSVSPSTNHKGAKFKVSNQAQEIEVLGTEFNIKAYKDETHVYTTLVEGSVVIDNGSVKRNLLPNQQSVLDVKDNNIQIAFVDVKAEIAWKKGIFSFKGKDLKRIMKVISRWYDVDFIFMDKDLENIKFKGVLGKDQSIENILKSIKTLSDIENYKINGKTIILN
ncbi:FecR family protein [Flavivirga aquimarina]|uniref:FecR family protein n=1 Tax=Flavivirga aquimarina TaxID=2027862 RepID=A0ABT8W8Z7_9FLAO|nr:FecR family protein [Flavivirga aquimarina]MDO5969603.1 FecR family protein [Flavivirga aquimarina]